MVKINKVVKLIIVGFFFCGTVFSQYRNLEQTAFQEGEVLKYRISYGIMQAGEAVLEVNGTDRDVKGRKLLHIVGTGRSLGTFNWFFKVRDTYQTFLDADGVFPWIFLRDVNEGGYKIKQDYTFYQNKNQVYNGADSTYSVPQFTQDMISALYYARSFDFSNVKSGDLFTINTFIDNEVYPLQIKFIAREEVKCKKGKFKCLKFRPVVQKGRIFKREEDVNVWITDDENKIPILAEAKILVGSLKMELVGYRGERNKMAKVE